MSEKEIKDILNEFFIENISSLIYEYYDKKCSICFYEYYDKKISKLVCGHEFHKECINKWFDQKETCPICKRKGAIYYPIQGELLIISEDDDIPGNKSLILRFFISSGNAEYKNKEFKYDGRYEEIILPYNLIGINLAKLYIIAFKRELLFHITKSENRINDNGELLIGICLTDIRLIMGMFSFRRTNNYGFTRIKEHNKKLVEDRICEFKRYGITEELEEYQNLNIEKILKEKIIFEINKN